MSDIRWVNDKRVMPVTKLKRPIKIDTQWTHKKQGMVCEVLEIWINTQGQVVVDLAAMGDGEIVSHSLSDFINEYRFKG